MLEDQKLLDATINAFQPDVIVHLAAQAGVRYSLETRAPISTAMSSAHSSDCS
ncbi:NAD-dependent epimerase/dehydratase family protein [Sphingobium cupriresistens]|uniref:NAD-dependent epimerase/dehydratase family protein n=1 Tax=Sphingobium cupriresistens TaxID=1132417 RepID=UPI001F5DE050|nr:NAD-dependent epimerase/dehydratase family protein [Sphingobium cupriresistens]